MASILDESAGPTAAELAAVAVPARRGIVLYDGPDYLLSQDETDTLIVTELHQFVTFEEADVLTDITHKPHAVRFLRPDYLKFVNAPVTPQTQTWLLAYAQRGGISTDPMVRLLAFRAWGDRDLSWNEPLPSFARSLGIESIHHRTDALGDVLVEARRGGHIASVIIRSDQIHDRKDFGPLLLEHIQILAKHFDRGGIRPEGRGTR